MLDSGSRPLLIPPQFDAPETRPHRGFLAQTTSTKTSTTPGTRQKMAKNLVIVESPAKARTVGRFLGSKYKAMASMGHVRDLPKGKLGVKVDDLSFEPDYMVIKERKKAFCLARLLKEF